MAGHARHGEQNVGMYTQICRCMDRVRGKPKFQAGVEGAQAGASHSPGLFSHAFVLFRPHL